MKPFIPAPILRSLRHRRMIRLAANNGVALCYGKKIIELSKEDKILRLGYGQEIYLEACLLSFDYFFESVKPLKLRDKRLADFSGPRYHKVSGFDFFPILFPSIPEPYITLEQYSAFARLKSGDVVFDLGAYAGLTTIVFARLVGSEGNVYGFEADPLNFETASENLETSRRFGAPDNITLVPKAVWWHGEGLEFSSEGAMGSSAVSIVGTGRGAILNVPTTTLADFCSEHKINRIDFIKVDIEGTEIEVLESSKDLLSQLRPRLIVEPHFVDGQLTTKRCCAILEEIGFATRLVPQTGSAIPLIQATPL